MSRHTVCHSPLWFIISMLLTIGLIRVKTTTGWYLTSENTLLNCSECNHNGDVSESSTKQECLLRGCVYNTSVNGIRPAGLCHLPVDTQLYYVESVKTSPGGVRVKLNIQHNNNEKHSFLYLEARGFTDGILQVKLYSKDVSTTEEDLEAFDIFDFQAPAQQYKLRATSGERALTFQIIRKSSNTILWETGWRDLLLTSGITHIIGKLTTRLEQQPFQSPDALYIGREPDGLSYALFLHNKDNERHVHFTCDNKAWFHTDLPEGLNFYLLLGPGNDDILHQYKTVLQISNASHSQIEDHSLKYRTKRQINEDESSRVDCLPDSADSSNYRSFTDECAHRGCRWQTSSTREVPACYIEKNSYGYNQLSNETIPRGTRYHLGRMSNSSMFGGDVETIALDVEHYSNDMLRIKFFDPSNRRFEVPGNWNYPDGAVTDRKYEFEITGTEPFQFRIKRRGIGTVIWDSSVGGLTFADQYLQISARLPNHNIYGFGQNRHRTFKHNTHFKRWPLFARDQAPPWMEGANLYGVHPFYTCLENDGNAHGVLLMNSNAQEYAFSPLPMLTYRTIGGILDFYFFMGPRPENVIQKYTQFIGRPVMPPYWSLGFQLSKFRYENLNNMREAVDRTLRNNIPVDVQHGDIDHTDNYKVFTVNSNFVGMGDYMRQMQSNGMKYIINVSPCVVTQQGYQPYDRLRQIAGGIKWPENYNIPSDSSDAVGHLLGFLWPSEKVVFFDYFKNSTNDLWEDLLVQHHNNIPFDGLWPDMNEPSNFGTNNHQPWNWPGNREAWSLKCYGNSLENPPYKTLAAYLYNAQLTDKTLCLSAVQGNNGEYRQYDVHNLFGWSQSPASLRGARRSTGKRSIVLPRSTFPGSGKTSGTWLGDNKSTWDDLKYSIIGMLEFNLFGIPYVGADICGYFEVANAELCKRWMQLGAFGTFFRNHNGGPNAQDPGVYDDHTIGVIRTAVEERYWLLPYLYTLFHEAHTQGSTVIRPVHHEFYLDANTRELDTQFMWGPALLISPILFQGQSSRSTYMPWQDGIRWYEYYSGAFVSNGGTYENIAIHSDTRTPLYIRGGHIIPLQAPANNTMYSRRNAFSLKVALDNLDLLGGRAEGHLFWDDGDSIDTYERNQYHQLRFICVRNRLLIAIEHSFPSVIQNLYIENIYIYGVLTNVHQVVVSSNNQSSPATNVLYAADRQVLELSGLRLDLTQYHAIEWMAEHL